jgi:hypothetical protein
VSSTIVKVSGKTSLVALAAAFAVVAPASGASTPFVATSPSSGTPATIFRLVIPSRLVERPRGAGLEVIPTRPSGRPRSCEEPWTAPKPRFDDGRVVFRLDPRGYGTRGRWCKGTWRVCVNSRKVVDDDQETGEGGVFRDALVRSRFVVR